MPSHLATICSQFAALSTPVNIVLWVQGETDAQEAVSSADYCAHVIAVEQQFRANSFTGKFLINLETWIPNVPPVPNATNVRIGQVMATDSINRLIGIDTDEMLGVYRWTDAHFSYAGKVEFARRMMNRLISFSPGQT